MLLSHLIYHVVAICVFFTKKYNQIGLMFWESSYRLPDSYTPHRHAILLCVFSYKCFIAFFISSEIHAFSIIFTISLTSILLPDNGQHAQGCIFGTWPSPANSDTKVVTCGQAQSASIAKSVLPIPAQHQRPSTGLQVQSYWRWVWNAANAGKVGILSFCRISQKLRPITQIRAFG